MTRELTQGFLEKTGSHLELSLQPSLGSRKYYTLAAGLRQTYGQATMKPAQANGLKLPDCPLCPAETVIIPRREAGG